MEFNTFKSIASVKQLNAKLRRLHKGLHGEFSSVCDIFNVYYNTKYVCGINEFAYLNYDKKCNNYVHKTNNKIIKKINELF